MLLKFAGIVISDDVREFDYSYYLGEDYKQTSTLPGQPSTVVCNHQSSFDNFVLTSRHKLNFLADWWTSKVPIIGKLYTAGGCLWVKLSGTEEERAQVRHDIERRQRLAENNPQVNTLGIFPEGMVSNGVYLLPFKKGAFEANTSIKPLVIKYSFKVISPQLCTKL